MNNIWAPWRIEYITSPKNSSCIFCSESPEQSRLIITKGRLCFAVMNRFPYTAGHCMVVPYRHVGDITELNPDELTEIMTLSQSIVIAMRTSLNPDGFNLGFNIGTAAGAGIDDHVHMHIVPRWKGDTNFMPVISDVHIISEHIDDTCKKIRENLL